MLSKVKLFCCLDKKPRLAWNSLAVESDLVFLILLPPPLECWDHRSVVYQLSCSLLRQIRPASVKPPPSPRRPRDFIFQILCSWSFRMMWMTGATLALFSREEMSCSHFPAGTGAVEEKFSILSHVPGHGSPWCPAVSATVSHPASFWTLIHPVTRQPLLLPVGLAGTPFHFQQLSWLIPVHGGRLSPCEIPEVRSSWENGARLTQVLTGFPIIF